MAMGLLLVEDDPMIGESMLEALRGERYAVDWVRDGVAAELSMRQDIYDLLVLDLGLPQRLGMDVLRRLRAQGGQTPVLIVTERDAGAGPGMGPRRPAGVRVRTIAGLAAAVVVGLPQHHL